MVANGWSRNRNSTSRMISTIQPIRKGESRMVGNAGWGGTRRIGGSSESKNPGGKPPPRLAMQRPSANGAASHEEVGPQLVLQGRLDPEQPVVLGHPFGPRGSPRLDLAAAGGHGEIGDERVLLFA